MAQLPEDHLLPRTLSTVSNWAASKHTIFQIYVYIAFNPITGGTVTRKDGWMVTGKCQVQYIEAGL